MNIGLFASGLIGYEITKFFSDEKEPLSCLVLDSKDIKGFNEQIKCASNIQEEKILYSNSLYDKKTINLLKEMNLDLAILAWWTYIIKDDIIDIPKYGYLNFHPSYLPYNKGKDPNFWSIVEDVPFGVSLHFINSGIDTGDIAFQTVIEKSWEDTGKTLYEKAIQEIIALFKNNFHLIKTGNIPRLSQNLNQGSFHKRKELDLASRIDLEKNYNARDLLNIIRARTFSPHPAAWFIDNGHKYEVIIEIKKASNRDNNNGTHISG
jgi:methionyl-tRNA formyltransferase